MLLLLFLLEENELWMDGLLDRWINVRARPRQNRRMYFDKNDDYKHAGSKQFIANNFS